ncbi:MAG: mucoidy inhibitor MuiA family protein [Myxococcaceae bacterium]|jgi:uncharacterized protein (TIGR02231 family)|nr:mucoidy inhibitor MuiA family protein [Myxococcaceae bacterium]
MNLPLTKVVVMEDRAQVERAGTLALAGGVTTIELAGLPVVAVDRSLKVEVTGATLHEARLVRRWKEKPKGGDPSALRQRVEALVDQQYEHDTDVYRLQTRLETLATTRRELLQSIAERAGYGEADVEAWQRQLDAVGTEQRAQEAAMREAQGRLEATRRELGATRQALALSEAREEALECALALSLEGSGQATVRVSYLVPCAVWRPAYRATLAKDTVTLEAEAIVWQRTGEPWTDVALQLSTARPTLGTTPPHLVADWLHLRPKSSAEKRAVDVSVREEVIQSAGERSQAAPEFPGLDDGGEARLLSVAGRVTVPSDGQPHRLPLFRFEAKADLELVCPAELTPLAFTVARFPNTSETVMLAGPIDLVRESGFVGRSQVAFTAPGETLKLSFGSADGVRVTRVLDEKPDENRLTGRRTTKKRVTLHVSNASAEARQLVIEERVLVSEVKEVEVQVLTKECDPAPGPLSRDGLARLNVALSPNATKTLKFTWEVSAAGKVAGL